MPTTYRIAGLIPYNKLSMPITGPGSRSFREIIRPGAFANSLRSGRNVPGLIEHEGALLLATTDAGTMRLKDSPDGLQFEMQIVAEGLGGYTYALVQRGDYRGVSFGFVIAEVNGDGWIKQKDGGMLRSLNNVNLTDVTLTCWPAYKDSRVEARSMADVEDSASSRRELEENERLLRLLECGSGIVPNRHQPDWQRQADERERILELLKIA